MSNTDFWGLVYSYAYAFGMLVIVEQVGKKLHWPYFVTRKIIHIGAGMWVWAILFLFDHWYIGIIPFATFIVLNFIFYRYRIFSAMDREKESPGTVYFAISITVLFLIGWRNAPSDYTYLVVPALMAMTWGDAMASLYGKFKGKHLYTFMGSTKSLEGSAMMLIFSFAAIGVSLLVLKELHINLVAEHLLLGKLVLVSFVTGIIAAVTEALSPVGTDNLSVPLISALTLYVLI